MGSWYWIGVCAGLGVAVGVLLAGVLTGTRLALTAGLVLAAGAGVAIGFALGQWDEAIALYRKAVQLDPWNRDLHITLGDVLTDNALWSMPEVDDEESRGSPPPGRTIAHAEMKPASSSQA